MRFHAPHRQPIDFKSGTSKNQGAFAGWRQEMGKLEDTTFRDEKVNYRRVSEAKLLPTPLLEARKLARGKSWRSQTNVFIKQAQLLVDYVDDFECLCETEHYVPTYQSLTNSELRGYFTWRSRIRQGQYPASCLAFLQIYVYEIINNIGVKSPNEGYEKLLALQKHYAHGYNSFDYYIDIWIRGYIVYYDLPSSYIEYEPDVAERKSIVAIANIANKSREEIIRAIKNIAGKWLNRSKFYSAHQYDFDEIIFRVLNKLNAHYSKGYKRDFIGQYFGDPEIYYLDLFRAAIFCNPLGRKNYVYSVDPFFCYYCEDCYWFVKMLHLSRRGIRKLEILMKSIDGIMRELYDFGHPVKIDVSTKWILKLIREEIEGFLTERSQKAQQKISIDLAALDRIRADALVTQTRLVTEEETGAPAQEVAIPAPEAPRPQVSQSGVSLTEAETRLLHCLLYNHDLGWLPAEGHMLAVLVDGINGKLYDRFEDNVLDDSPQVLPDYVDDLKEMFAE